MDQTVFAEYLFEPRTFQSDVHGCSKVVWVDNHTGYNGECYLMSSEEGEIFGNKATNIL